MFKSQENSYLPMKIRRFFVKSALGKDFTCFLRTSSEKINLETCFRGKKGEISRGILIHTAEIAEESMERHGKQ